MGAKLIGRAFAFASAVDLNPNEFRLLLWMCLHALDDDEPPRYFGKRESSALGLGRIVPDEPHILDPDFAVISTVRTNAFQRVKVATKALVDCHAIQSLNKGKHGATAQYAITLGTPYVLEKVRSAYRNSSPGVPIQGRRTYPQGTSQEYKEQISGEHRDPAFTYVEPVESGANR